MPERRQTARARSFVSGRIEFNKLASSLNCLVRNLSDGGARLDFSEAVLIPDDFRLALVERGISRDARIVWRHASTAGVAFAGG